MNYHWLHTISKGRTASYTKPNRNVSFTAFTIENIFNAIMANSTVLTCLYSLKIKVKKELKDQFRGNGIQTKPSSHDE